MDARDQAYARRTARRAEGRSAALAAGCRRNHRTMELPAPARRVTRIGGVRGGQPGDDQDVRDHATDLGADEVDGANVRDSAELGIVTGGSEVSATFSRLPFDHLFFTGSPSVGSLVQQAAAQNLVPVTLELGGKNPVVVSQPGDSQDRTHDCARRRRGHEDLRRRGVRSGLGRQTIFGADGRHRPHQPAARAARGVLVRARQRRLPALRCPYPQSRRGAQ
jgi:hypothetical protein